MNQKSMTNVVNGVENALGFPILRRGVGRGQTQMHSVKSEEGLNGTINEPNVVVNLYALNWQAELGGGIGESNYVIV